MSFLTMNDITPALMEAVSNGVCDYLSGDEDDLCNSIAFQIEEVLPCSYGTSTVADLIDLFMTKLERQELCKGLPSERVVVQMAKRHKDSFRFSESHVGYSLLVKTKADQEWASVNLKVLEFDKKSFSFLPSTLPETNYALFDAKKFVKTINDILAQDMEENGSQVSVAWPDGTPARFGDTFKEKDKTAIHRVSSISVDENGNVWLYHNDTGYPIESCERYDGMSCRDVSQEKSEFHCSECDFNTKSKYFMLFSYCPNCGKPIVK